jgi:hypothetical protein
MAAIKSESVAGFIPESVADFPRNTHSYRKTKVQQIDFHVSFGFNRNAPDYIVGVGYSFRFDGFW